MEIRRLSGWLLTTFTLVSLVCTQVVYDRTTRPFRSTTEETIREQATPLLPNLKTLRLLSFGNERVLADLLWLEAIQYFGGGLTNNYPALGPMTETITDLDPKFSYPYRFGMVVLPLMGQKAAAERVGLKAQKNLPNDGLLTYYLATVYHIDLKQYKKAAYYYELASTEPGSPRAAKALAGAAYNQVHESIQDRLVAISYWETVYTNAKSDDERKRAKQWWDHMQIVYSIELAAQQYKTKNGDYPPDIAALVSAGFLSSVPVSPVNRLLILDPSSGRVNFDRVIMQSGS